MIISKKKLERLMQEHTAKAVAEQQHRDMLDRELQNMRRDYYTIESSLREMIRDIGTRVDRLEASMHGENKPKDPFAPAPEWR